MTNNDNALNTILNANISKEEKDFLLAEYAKQGLKERNKKKTKEELKEIREELVEKNRERSKKLKEDWAKKVKDEQEKKIAEESADTQRRIIEEICRKGSNYEINALFHNNKDIMEKYGKKVYIDIDVDDLDIIYEKDIKEQKLEDNNEENINEKTEEEPPKIEPIDEVKKEEIKEKEPTKKEKIEKGMKNWPKTPEEFMSRGGGNPEKRSIVKTISDILEKFKPKKAEVSEDELLKKEPSVIEAAPIELPEVEVPEEQLLNKETPVIDDEQKIDVNKGIIANSIVPEQQLLNIENDPILKELEEQPIIPMYEDSPKPDLNETQEINLDQAYDIYNMQMNQGKSL